MASIRLMSLDDTAAILAGPERSRGWKQVVGDRHETLDAHIEQMTAARDYLEAPCSPVPGNTPSTAASTSGRPSGSRPRRLREDATLPGSPAFPRICQML
jgi:hypothetical protein